MNITVEQIKNEKIFYPFVVTMSVHISYKNKPLDNFRPRVPKPDLKSCLIWFIAFILIVVLIVSISVIFGFG